MDKYWQIVDIDTKSIIKRYGYLHQAIKDIKEYKNCKIQSVEPLVNGNYLKRDINPVLSNKGR